jgi:hypothetical protein
MYLSIEKLDYRYGRRCKREKRIIGALPGHMRLIARGGLEVVKSRE